MKRSGVVGLFAVAALAFSGIAASSASAECYQVKIKETGRHKLANCTDAEAAKGEYIETQPFGIQFAAGVFCQKVLILKTGNHNVPACNDEEKAGGEYVLVFAVPVGGPGFVVGGDANLLGTGGTANLTTRNLGNFTLKPTTGPVIVCTGLSAPTLLLGGAPGKSDTKITYSGCTVESHPKCDALNKGGTPGTILVNANDELVYDGTKAQALNEEAPVGDLFTTSGSSFVTIVFDALESGACPGTAVETAVTGNVVGEVEPVNTMSTQGMLTFPATAIKKVYRSKGAGALPEEVTTGLKAFGVSAIQIGLADLELESGEAWGVASPDLEP